MVNVNAVSEHYLERSNMMYDILTTDAGMLPPEGRDMVADAHRILGRAAEAEAFDPQPEDIEHPVLVQMIAEEWMRGLLVDKGD